MTEPEAGTDQTSIHDKLNRILEFQEKLEPYLPLLGKLAAMLDNPAARFRTMMKPRKGQNGDRDS